MEPPCASVREACWPKMTPLCLALSLFREEAEYCEEPVTFARGARCFVSLTGRVALHLTKPTPMRLVVHETPRLDRHHHLPRSV